MRSGRKYISVRHAVLPSGRWLKFVSTISQLLSRLKGFEISAILRLLDWIDAPYTQNFEILKFLESQESKKLKSI
jgi:hypothetical protein